MAELHALHRAVWGDVSYERHLAERRLRTHRAVSTLLMALGVVVAGLALAVTTLPGTDEPARRDGLPPRSGTPATRPVSAEPDRSATSRRPASTLVSTAASTRAPAVTATVTARTTVPRPPAPTATTVPRRRRPHALARTGASTEKLLVVAFVLLAAGLAIRRGKSTGRRTPAS
jgi:hypothetical protein